MAFERIKLFSKLELDFEADTGSSLTVYTDMPGNAMNARAFLNPPIGSRRTVAFRLPYNTQGHFLKLALLPFGGFVLYGARIWARELPNGQWGWYTIPVIPTPVEFSPMELPIPRTSDSWSSASLPIPATPDSWAALSLPIKQTPPVPDFIDLEMDR